MRVAAGDSAWMPAFAGMTLERRVHRRDRLHHRRDPCRGLDGFGLHPVLLQYTLVAVDAHAAAVHRADGEAEQLEIVLLDAVGSDGVHPEARRQRAIFR